jgi:putative flippase GtrA
MFEYYKKLKRKHKNIFTFFVLIAIILIWRGIWGLGDLYLFPSNELISLLSSILIGIIILLGLRFTMSRLIE